MMSKHPLDLPAGRKLSREELAEALRLSIIAELDAINLYLQLARATEDEKIRRIFEDIAREEKTHVGEFLEALKSLDAEQVEELKAGAREVSELTGITAPDPQDGDAEPFTEGEWRYLKNQFTAAADSVRTFRKHLPLTRVGRGVMSVPVERAGGVTTLLPLSEISVKFYVSQSSIDHARVSRQPMEITDTLRAAVELGLSEDRFVLDSLLSLKNSIKVQISDWSKPGSAVEEVAAAVAKLVGRNVPPPFLLFVSPSRFSKLLSVHEKTGVMELTRVKALAEVVTLPAMPDDTVLLVSSTGRVLDLVLGADTEVDYIGPENGRHAFRGWETLAVRVRLEEGVAVLKQV